MSSAAQIAPYALRFRRAVEQAVRQILDGAEAAQLPPAVPRREQERDHYLASRVQHALRVHHVRGTDPCQPKPALRVGDGIGREVPTPAVRDPAYRIALLHEYVVCVAVPGVVCDHDVGTSKRQGRPVTMEGRRGSKERFDAIATASHHVDAEASGLLDRQGRCGNPLIEREEPDEVRARIVQRQLREGPRISACDLVARARPSRPVPGRRRHVPSSGAGPRYGGRTHGAGAAKLTHLAAEPDLQSLLAVRVCRPDHTAIFAVGIPGRRVGYLPGGFRHARRLPGGRRAGLPRHPTRSPRRRSSTPSGSRCGT